MAARAGGRALAHRRSPDAAAAPRCLELPAMTPFLYGIEARELTWDLQEMLCGARVTSNYIRIGGVKHDMPAGFPASCRDDHREDRATLLARLRRRRHAATASSSTACEGTGRDPAATSCIRYAVTGPAAALGRRAARPAQGRALPRLRPDRLRRAGRRGRRQLRSLSWCASRRCSRACASSSSVSRSSRSSARGRSTSTIRACAGRPRAASSTAWRS